MQSDLKSKLESALEAYAVRSGHALKEVGAVLFDLDGVLYDSMPGHCRAWKQMCDENDIISESDEFYVYEGRTGASTIDILFRRQFGHGAIDDDVKRLYARKSELFRAEGPAPLMSGARKAVETVRAAGAIPVLVTGSGQTSILERLNIDYDDAFPIEHRVTAHDVKYGKPDPEPYLMGLVKAGVGKCKAVAVDNAPLGVESASRAGVFTIGVRTGPIPEGMLREAGADIEIFSMSECAVLLKELL